MHMLLIIGGKSHKAAMLTLANINTFGASICMFFSITFFLSSDEGLEPCFKPTMVEILLFIKDLLNREINILLDIICKPETLFCGHFDPQDLS